MNKQPENLSVTTQLEKPSYFLVAKVKIMIPGLPLMTGWLSYLQLSSPSQRSRLDQMLTGLRPKANEFTDDPLGRCRESLGVQLWDKQRDVIEKLLALTCQVLVGAGHHVGKTIVSARLASWFYDSFNPSQALCTAPTKAGVCDVLFAELRKLRSSQNGFSPKETLLEEPRATAHYGALRRTTAQLTHRHSVRSHHSQDRGVSGPACRAVPGRQRRGIPQNAGEL